MRTELGNAGGGERQRDDPEKVAADLKLQIDHVRQWYARERWKLTSRSFAPKRPS